MLQGNEEKLKEMKNGLYRLIGNTMINRVPLTSTGS